MVDRKEASFVLEGRPTPATGRPGPPDGCEGAGRFELAVVFTSFDATIAALKMAGALASGLSAQITLVVAQAVPYPLPLEDPPVPLDFIRPRLGQIVSDSPVETTIRHYLCRDRLVTLTAVLKRGSIVVIGGRKKWWPTREKILAWRLRRFGHDVILAETT
jgi:hypothetical protein